MKITEKVSFNIASEASYVYILSGQKLSEKSQKWSILASYWKSEACGQPVLPKSSAFIGQKVVENAKIKKFKCDILSNFQTMWHRWNPFIFILFPMFYALVNPWPAKTSDVKQFSNQTFN